ncbi:MAG TPA: hypothetical protein VMN03_09640 [Burkholderiales bacterium]|nr:hypothetical protein [Burkholderiales bacterium]
MTAVQIPAYPVLGFAAMEPLGTWEPWSRPSGLVVMVGRASISIALSLSSPARWRIRSALVRSKQLRAMRRQASAWWRRYSALGMTDPGISQLQHDNVENRQWFRDELSQEPPGGGLKGFVTFRKNYTSGVEF